MSLIIQYCEKCGERVSPDDVKSGAALHYKDESYCKACKDVILPELQKDPDFAAFQKQQQRNRAAAAASTSSGQSSRSGILEMPRGASGRARRGSGVMQRRTPGRRSGANHQPASQSRASSARPGPSSQGDNKVAYIVGAVGALIVLIGLVIMLNSGNPPEGTPTDDKKAPPKTSQKKPKLDLIKKSKTPAEDNSLVAREFRKLKKFRRANPDKHKTVLDKLDTYLRDASGTPYEKMAMRIRGEVRKALDLEARKTFDQLKQIIDQLAKEGSFLLALEKWDEFSPELLTPKWKAMIDVHLNEIKAMKKRADEARFTKGTPPRDGTPVEVFNGHSLEGWRVSSDSERWTARSGVLTVNTTGASKSSFGFFFHKIGGKRYQFKDFHLSFEIQLEAGTMAVLGRIPPKAGPTLINVNVYASAFERNKWYKAHLVVRGGRAEWWIEKAVSLRPMTSFTSPEGAVGFQAQPNTRFMLRNIKMAVLAQGGLYQPPKKQSGPDRATQPRNPTMGKGAIKGLSPEKWFDGKTLDSWTSRGSWQVSPEGVITVDTSTQTTSLLLRGDPDWVDYQLSAQVRGLKGDLTIVTRWDGKISSSVKLSEQLFPNKTSWYTVSLTVRGDQKIVELPQLGKKQAFKAGTATHGLAGFAIKKGHTVQLQNLKLTLYKKR